MISEDEYSQFTDRPIPEEIWRGNLAHLYPLFVDKLWEMVQILENEGVRFYLTSGFRSHAEQQKLYDQGRKTPGNKVTNARPGSSAHQYGVAADFTKDANVDRAGLQPSWNVSEYEALAKAAEAVGLEAGLRWKMVDGPHVQLPLSKHGLTMKILNAAYQHGGIDEVFAVLDEQDWG